MASRKDPGKEPEEPFRRPSPVEDMRKALGECAEGIDDDTLLLLKGYAQAVIAQMFREIERKLQRDDPQAGGAEDAEGL